MVIGTTLFVLIILVVAIWIIVEVKRLKHKLLAIFLIGLIIFSYMSFTLVLKGHDVNLKTVSGLMEGSKLYLSWLGSAFDNFKLLTTYAVKQDWGAEDVNETIG